MLWMRLSVEEEGRGGYSKTKLETLGRKRWFIKRGRGKQQWGRQCGRSPAKTIKKHTCNWTRRVHYSLRQRGTHTMESHGCPNTRMLESMERFGLVLGDFGVTFEVILIWLGCCQKERIILWLDIQINLWRRREDKSKGRAIAYKEASVPWIHQDEGCLVFCGLDYVICRTVLTALWSSLLWSLLLCKILFYLLFIF